MGVPYRKTSLARKKKRRSHQNIQPPNWMDCPNCGAAVNSYTGDGLHSPEDEPWRLICDKCETEIVV